MKVALSKVAGTTDSLFSSTTRFVPRPPTAEVSSTCVETRVRTAGWLQKWRWVFRKWRNGNSWLVIAQRVVTSVNNGVLTWLELCFCLLPYSCVQLQQQPSLGRKSC